ncbi:MAG: S8 family serine peptidase [Chloroflexales bacterium]|nr:S8 family serine peptidase [Chloroflexales bacterium]
MLLLKKRLARIGFSVFLVLTIGLSSTVATFAQSNNPNRTLPDSVSDLKLETPLTDIVLSPETKLNPQLLEMQGPQQVVVRLNENPVAVIAARNPRAVLQRRQLDRVQQQQDSFLRQARAADSGLKMLGTARLALNAVILEVDAVTLAALAARPEVVSINPVLDYELDLSDTVPYIGATAVQESGYDGSGVKVAVLDSGIDYTHIALGGAGSREAYEAAWGVDVNDPRNTTRDGLFPTAKVVGGYDFVGEFWDRTNVTELSPDPDPIDLDGHGTHVADIIGGVNGVAPGVDFYAVKVCSAVSSACSGVALLQGMDFALDPNGDGLVNDKVDIINMSLGSPYGQAFDDDLSTAVDNASALGVLTVASAGNSADKPYVTGTPAGTTTALSVAQTQTPSAFLPLLEIVEPSSIAGQYAAVFQPWSSMLTDVIEAPVQYGDGAGGNLNACADFAPGSLTGKIVLVDRGGCTFSSKIYRVEQGGGLAGVIGLVAPGEPFSGGFGGDTPAPAIPGFMISQADSNTVKSQLDAGVTARLDPATILPLVKHLVGSSSRGPTMNYNSLPKPEIGAPGASISAVAGSGAGVEPFGGTSGAAPMVSGAAALLRQAHPFRPIRDLKPMLMNTAEINVMNRPAFFDGDKAAITRIGGGEVRVDRALNTPAAAWDLFTRSGTLAFGFLDVTDESVTLVRRATVRNYTGETLTYQIKPTFRFTDDIENGAITISAPESITIPPLRNAGFNVVMTIDGAKLREWGLNSGSQGANADILTTFEYDGYIFLDDPTTATSDDLHLAWHILPRLAANVTAETTTVVPNSSITLANSGVGTGYVNTYSLIGVSPNLPEGERGEQNPTPDLRYVGVQTFPVDAGVCSDNPSFVMSFAVNTWERQTHANAPARFEFYLDTNQDGTTDYVVFNADRSVSQLSQSTTTDGRNATYVQNNATGRASVFFFTDHGTNSANTVLTFCGEQIGMNAENLGQLMGVRAVARDRSFTGVVTDAIDGITIAPGGENYLAINPEGGTSIDMPANGSTPLNIVAVEGASANPSETGVLLFLDAVRSGGVKGGAPVDNEAIAITVTP